MERPASGSQKSKKQKEKRTSIAEVDLYATSPGRYSPRSFFQTGYYAWQVLRQLGRLTPLEFRDHLAKNLTELGVIEESRQSLLNAIGTPPQEDTFWLTLQDIVQDYQLAEEVDFSLRVLDAKYSPPPASWFRKFRQSLTTIHVIPWRELPEDSWFWRNQQDISVLSDTRWGEVFRKSFVEKYGKPPPTGWAREALNILDQLRGIQDQARNQYQQRVRWLQKKAKGLLEQIGRALHEVGQGKTELPPKEKEAIVDTCKKWRPICEALNKTFKELWEQPKYQPSRLCGKEARGMLAEKLGVSMKDVKAIESYLQKPSRTASKSTPFSAMIRMVAHEFPGIGEKTVEEMWRDYLKVHPDERRRRRSIV